MSEDNVLRHEIASLYKDLLVASKEIGRLQALNHAAAETFARQIGVLRAQLAASEKKHRDIYYKTAHEVEQILGKALGCPWFKDDLKNFPDATEADGVCIGEHVPESIAEAAANRIVLLESQVTDLESQRDLALEEITGLRAALHDAESAYSQLAASQERIRVLETLLTADVHAENVAISDELELALERERILMEGIIRIRAMATPSCYFAVAESYQVVNATNEILKAAEEVKP